MSNLKSQSDLEKEILIKLLTHFVYKLQTILDIQLSPSESYSFIPIDQMDITQLRARLTKIEDKIIQLIKNPSNQKPSLNSILNELKEENESISHEIDSLS